MLPSPSAAPVYQGSSAAFCRWNSAPPLFATNAFEAGMLFFGFVLVGSSRTCCEPTPAPPQPACSPGRVHEGTVLPGAIAPRPPRKSGSWSGSLTNCASCCVIGWTSASVTTDGAAPRYDARTKELPVPPSTPCVPHEQQTVA